MEAFLVSTGVVAIAEIGDKTQLLAILLASRFRKPSAIIAGIFAATVVNHLGAAWIGALTARWLTPQALAWALAISFLAMAAWALMPDKADNEAPGAGRGGAFIATLIAFFLVEMGDKTQLATVALGARFDDVALVAAGATLGMMLANIPAVFLGEAVMRIAPPRLVRLTAAAIFATLGVLALAAAIAQGAHST